MKRSLRRATLLAAMGITGCAAPPQSLSPQFARGRADATKAAITPPANRDASDGSAVAQALLPVATVAYQGDDQAESLQLPLPADTPPQASAPAPEAAGRVFLPPPEIPPAPSVTWPADSTLAGAPPMSLAELEVIACQNNPTLLQARAQIEGSLGKAIQAGLWPNPTVMYRAEQIGVEGTAGEFHGGIVRQRVVTAHKLDLSRQKFLARTRTAEWVALAQQYRVLNDIRIHYFRTRGRQQLVDVQQQLLKNAEDNVVTFREMFNVGQATRTEVHQANVMLQQHRLNLLMAENDFQQSFHELTGVAQAADLEFIAFNPGDWLLHCHMVHHMMNHMVRQVGPRIRDDVDIGRYRTSLTSRPAVKFPHTDPGFQLPGYPQMMQGNEMPPEAMQKINGRRETRGMRPMWHMGVKGLMTIVRVLPDDLYELVVNSDQDVQPGQVFEEIKRRRGKVEGPSETS